MEIDFESFMRRILWFNFFVMSVICSSNGQVIIKDSISLESEFKPIGNFQISTITSSSGSYEVKVFISTATGIHHPSPRKITLTVDTTYVIEDCTTCGIPSNGYNKIVYSKSSVVKIEYTGSTNAPKVSLKKTSGDAYISNYDILFNYPPQLGYPPNVVAGYVIVTNNTINTVLQPQWDSCFAQVDPRWASKHYDHKTTKDTTIGKVGCALSEMATVLSAMGININPDRLNDSMKVGKRGFSGYDILWEYIDLYPGNNKIRVGGKIGHGLVKKKDNTLDTINSIPISFQLIDSHLSKGQPVAVQVASLRSDNTVSGHWVVIIGKDSTKTGADAYKIYDAGTFVQCKARTLAFPKYLGGKVYRYIYFVPKN